MDFLKRNWFTLGLVGAVFFGWLLKDLYPGNSGIWLGLRNLAIIEIFFISGLTIPSRQLVKATLQWRAHVYIQLMSLGLFPFVMWALQPVWRALFPEELVIGLLVVGALPTTIVSCVALTRIARGDEVVALVNATAGNLLGIIVTPTLLLLMLGTAGQVDAVAVFQKLLFMVVLPMAAGQLIRYLFWRPDDRAKKFLKYGSHSGILVILMIVMMKTFITEISVNPLHLGFLAIISFVLHLGALGLAWASSAWKPLRLDLPARRAALFCISQKTLALGAPLIAIAFAEHPGIGLIIVPIVIYHPIQLLFDAALAGRLGRASE